MAQDHGPEQPVVNVVGERVALGRAAATRPVARPPALGQRPCRRAPLRRAARAHHAGAGRDLVRRRGGRDEPPPVHNVRAPSLAVDRPV